MGLGPSEGGHCCHYYPCIVLLKRNTVHTVGGATRFRMIGELELETVMTVDQSNTVEFGGCFPYMGVQRSLHKLPARSGKPNSTRLIDRMHLVDPARFTASNRKRRGPVELWVIIIS